MHVCHPGGWRNYRGSFFGRIYEAALILVGKQSLHRAWQTGLDEGSRLEWRRIMVNGGDLIPVMNAAIIATEAHRVGGSLPSLKRLREIRKAAWERYKNGSDIPYCEDAA